MLGILICTPEYGILYRNTGVLGPWGAQHHRDPASRRVEAEHLVIFFWRTLLQRCRVTFQLGRKVSLLLYQPFCLWTPPGESEKNELPPCVTYVVNDTLLSKYDKYKTKILY